MESSREAADRYMKTHPFTIAGFNEPEVRLIGNAYRAAFEAGYAHTEELRRRIVALEGALKVAEKALIFFDQFEVSSGASGGIYNPKLGCFEHSDLGSWSCFPAKEALTAIRAARGGE